MGSTRKIDPVATRVLVIEDDDAVRHAIVAPIRAEAVEVLEADSCASALRALACKPDLVICDLRLPDGNAFELIPRVRDAAPGVPIYIVTRHGTIDFAVRAVKEGAEDFLTKPLDSAMLRDLAREISDRKAARASGLRPQIDTRTQPERSRSAAMLRVEEQVERLLHASCSVLLLGETGTGKSVLARRIHELGARGSGPMVDINCAGLTKELVEAELFGHERGAFTGAHASKPGLFEAANGGTLFLDEIGDLDLQVQPKLLKVLEEKRFRRLGDVRERSVDVRIIGATHKDLMEAATRGAFRADLFYRMSTMCITVPPLRERREDIIPLAHRMLSDMGARDLELSADAQACLLDHTWPGNLRELRNVLERALLLRRGASLARDDLRFDPGSSPRMAVVPAVDPPSGGRRASAPSTPQQAPPASRTLREMEREHIWAALAAENGRVDAAAVRLGIPRSTLYQRIKAYRLRVSELRRKVDPRGPNED
jgi:DNA-binding NtrC family response regulator